jgi:predicted nuclease of predicted toxin-antitoxin system
MRILIDEDLPVALAPHVREGGHEVVHIEDLGWKGVKNSDLLRRASGVYDVLLTGDTNMPNQQNLAQFDVAVVQLRPRRKMIDQLVALVPRALAAIPGAPKGAVTVIAPD